MLQEFLVFPLPYAISPKYQGEFNSGKSSVINALLGSKYLKEGVVPTTNEITFLRYSNLDSGEAQRCERHPDGQYICYLPAPFLKEVSHIPELSPINRFCTSISLHF